MKLTKKLEAEILKIYHTYWDAYLQGDFKTFASFLDDGLTTVGTAAGEVFTSKREALNFYKTTADQMTGKADFRNRRIRLKVVGGTVVTNEQADLYVLIDGVWTFYGHARITAIFEQKGNEWKLVHQHGSFPDSRTADGDQIATEKIKEENIKLKEAIKRRTIDLENKNRELEIEASLERVRAVAMSMNKPDDVLNVCKLMFEELKALDFGDLRNALINFWDDKNQQLLDYDYSDFAGAHFARLDYNSHPVFEAFQKKIRKSKDAFAKLTITKDDLKSWRQRRKESGEYDDPRLKKISALYYYFYSTGIGALGISTFSPISKSNLEVLKRFRNVFDLAYRRFLDLQKAEAQAREAQIQLALERVRARTMAMQHSDELKDVAYELRVQLAALGTSELETCAINLYEKYDDSIEAWVAIRPPDSPKEIVEFHFLLPKAGIFIIEDMLQTYLSGAEDYIFELTGEKGVQWMQTMEKLLPAMYFAAAATPDFEKTGSVNAWFYVHYFPGGALIMITMTPPLEESKQLLKRFAQVFGLAYRRFADLQKAEAQAREAQIETALEKVRSRSLAMHKSDELLEVVKILSDQLTQLEFKFDNVSFGENNQADDFKFWVATSGNAQPIQIQVPYLDNPAPKRVKEAQKKGIRFFTDILSQEENRQWSQHLIDNSTSLKSLPGNVKDYILNSPGYARSTVILKNINIYIGNYKAIPYTDYENHLFQRFAQVFEQSYTRFLDLQKAEAQAREANIETALERVRSRSLAMHKSDELNEVVIILFEQFIGLGISIDGININILNENRTGFDSWFAAPGYTKAVCMFTPFFDSKVMNDIVHSINDNNELLHKVYTRQEKNEYFSWLYQNSAYRQLPEERKQMILAAESWRLVVGMVGNSGISIHSYTGKTFTDKDFEIVIRFAKVFHQTYTRFLDLKKAEEQTREAQIEVAVERVRAKALAMHKSDEIMTVVLTMRNELESLNIPGVLSTSITLRQEDGSIRLWDNTSTKQLADGLWESTDMVFRLEDNNPDFYFNRIWKTNEKYFVIEQDENDLPVTVDWVRSFDTGMADTIVHFFKENDVKHVWHPGVQLSHGKLNLDSLIAPEPEMKTILLKMGAAFDLAYKRFLDLQKAEAQAREAQIEAALERVRSRTIGMQKSEELREVIQIVFEQLRYLGFKIDSAHFNLNYKESDDYNLWTAAPGQPYPVKTYIPYFNHPVFATAREAKEKGLDFFTESYTREEKNEFFEHLFSYAPGIPEERKNYILSGQGVAASTVLLNQISLWIMNYSGVPYSAAENGILKRFGKIFEQSHTRFLDLQKAEAQAREAIKQASLDRIRAEIASMRTTGDLETITPLIWNELTVLGVPFIRCGVFIMNDLQRVTHTYLSTPDGKAIAAFDLAYDTPGNISQIVHQWQNKKLYIDYWDEEAYTAFAGNLVQKGIFTSPEQYFSTLPGGGFYLHFAPFLQGMLYVGNTTQLSDEEIDLIQSVANAFATAYARYEDFNKLEAAKKQVDKTLNELQLTQKQLIQSEKMASLGELTAGIAHEIQNPLNFVNNFSEINKELLHEMNEEIEKGNLKEVKLLAKNIIENEQKINHHGTRADAIVKGMLQHSRTSSGQKEPTDINELADEYLRLAYHGLRAKDKSFNATLKTDFDETISNINIVPQDIGRVILNLITNAFYAVCQKKKECQSEHIEDYEPTVTVITKKINDKVEIKVADNGNGIPQNIIDKIFQPFFSTKPAGQGTGLGLSLSYDIVKAHGGELRVETKENEFTSFIIILPINS